LLKIESNTTLPPLSFCDGPRILQKVRDVIVQVVEYPLYILSSLGKKEVGWVSMKSKGRTYCSERGGKSEGEGQMRRTREKKRGKSSDTLSHS
jgi:hypothetical protein